MNELQKSFIQNGASFLMHYNHNHDKLGRFAKSTLFVSGSSKTQSKDSGYYRKKLPRQVRKELKSSMKSGDRIIVGDAPGIDRQVQDYLNKKKYGNVEVYGPGKEVRYSANSNWKTNAVDSKHPKGSKEWLAEKDKVMSKEADKGLAVVLDEGSRATRNNIDRLSSEGKDVSVFQISKDGKKKDIKIDNEQLESSWHNVYKQTEELAKINLNYDLKNNQADLYDWRDAFKKGYYIDDIPKKEQEKYRKREAEYYLKYQKMYDNNLSTYVDEHKPPLDYPSYNQDSVVMYAFDQAVSEAIYDPVGMEGRRKYKKE